MSWLKKLISRLSGKDEEPSGRESLGKLGIDLVRDEKLGARLETIYGLLEQPKYEKYVYTAQLIGVGGRRGS